MKNVLLVCGGKSYEHDISVVTATQIFSKTKLDDVNLIFFYISRDNRYFIYTAKKVDLTEFSANNFNEKNKNFKEVVFVSSEKNKLFAKSMFGLKEYVTVNNAIICCHGSSGENGKLVSMLESMGISTTSGMFDSLAVCMNKFLFKQVMKGLKIPIVKGFRLKRGECETSEKTINFKLSVLKFPVVIKPVNGGSSIGIFIANDIQEFKKKTIEAFEFDNELLIERFIENAREFNVAVLGFGDDVKVSEIDEPLKQNELLTFADKYLTSNGSKKLGGNKNSMVTQKRNLPANISEELTDKIKNSATKIFSNLNLCGVVRIDFLYDENQDKLYVCEVNAVPGSLSYYFFDKGRFLLNDFVEKLIELSERKAIYESTFKKEFATSVLD